MTNTALESTAKVPTSFKNLNKEELLAAAEFFGTETEGNVTVLKMDLEENGVTWESYAKAFLEPKVEDVVAEDAVGEAVSELENIDEPEYNIVTAQPNIVMPEKYLVRMTRKNPYFEFKRYKFTADNPYAIMDPEDAKDLLEGEEGFRQAFPSELSDFYS
jgi:hypothetical protein